MTSKVISFVTMKGGSGKSTLAICLAAHWHRAGVPVAIVDADPAATLARWVTLGEDLAALPVLPAADATLDRRVEELRDNGIRRIVIDTPGFHSPATDAAVRHADLILIPMRPSPVDFQVAADTAEHIERLAPERGGAQIRFVLNQTTRGTVIARHMRAQMEAGGFRPLEVELAARVAYSEAALAGTTPGWYQPNGAAAADIVHFAEEADALLSATGP